MKARSNKGITLLETAFVLAIMSTVAAIALPATKGALSSYHLQAASASLAGAIQTTRFSALMHGYTYNLTFNPANQSYQVAAKVPPATTFTNSASPSVWCACSDVTVSAATTLEFHANGTVTATTGALSFTLSTAMSSTTISVSPVGAVTTVNQ